MNGSGGAGAPGNPAALQPPSESAGAGGRFLLFIILKSYIVGVVSSTMYYFSVQKRQNLLGVPRCQCAFLLFAAAISTAPQQRGTGRTVCLGAQTPPAGQTSVPLRALPLNAPQPQTALSLQDKGRNSEVTEAKGILPNLENAGI